MTRRRVTQADIAELRKRAPSGPDSNEVGVIVRTVVDPARQARPYTPTQEAMIAAAVAEFRKDGRIRRLIFDSPDAAGEGACSYG
jgi:hypothetical protein